MHAMACLIGCLLVSFSLEGVGATLTAEPEVSLTIRMQGNTHIRDGDPVAEGRIRMLEAHSAVQVWLAAAKSGEAADRYALNGRNYPRHELRVRLQIRSSEPDTRGGQGRILRTAEELIRYNVVADGDQQVAPDEYELTVRATAYRH